MTKKANNDNVSIKLGNGKYFYITPGGAKLTSGGKSRSLPECFKNAITNKGDRRKIRKTLRKMGRMQELMKTLEK